MTKIVYADLCTCGRAPAYQDGLCVGCYSIRTAKAVIGIRAPGGCSNCGRPDVRAKGRCVTCYQYLWRYGVDRKMERRREIYFCVNCGDTRLYTRERCKACGEYLRRRGIERPQRLIEMHRARGYRPRKRGICVTCPRKPQAGRAECSTCRARRQRRNKQRTLNAAPAEGGDDHAAR